MRKSTKFIFFRDDDVFCLDSKFSRLLDLFEELDAPLALSVVPSLMTGPFKQRIREACGKTNKRLSIAQHGWAHRAHCSRAPYHEFGYSRTFQEQFSDISRGKNIIKDELGVVCGVFVPPWNSFDENTVKALKAAKFKSVSIDLKYAIMPLSGMEYIFTELFFNKKEPQGNWYSEDLSSMMRKILLFQDSYIGIELHHRHFKRRDFIKLRSLIALLKRQNGVRIVSLDLLVRKQLKKKKICKSGVLYFLGYQFVPKPFSISPGRLNPDTFLSSGHTLFNKLELFRKPEKIIADQLYLELKRSVGALAPKNEPIGLFLSGGIDSAVILHLLREVCGNKIYTFTASFRRDSGHMGVCDKLAKYYSTIHRNIFLPPAILLALDSFYEHNIPQPIGDNGLLTNFFLTFKMKEYAKFIFTGDGADCLLGGLGPHENSEFFLSADELNMYFSRNFPKIDIKLPARQALPKPMGRDRLKDTIIFDLNFLVRNRLDYILYPAAIWKAKACLPYLDKSVVNFGLKIPSRYLIRGNCRKAILRSAFDGKLPDFVLKRTKRGFSPPFNEWYRQNMHFVSGKFMIAEDMGIPREYLRALLKTIKKSDQYQVGMKTWLILNLASWYEHSFNKQGQSHDIPCIRSILR